MRKWIVGGAVVVMTLAVAFSAISNAEAQQRQRPSPPAKAECKFSDGKAINVDYSSPRMRGRKIYGDLVPFGKEWRTGANAATKFVTTADLTIAGKAIPAGDYTLYTVPEQGKWTLVVSKKTGQWGIPYPGAGEDLLRADMKVSSLSAPLEEFTISFAQSGNTCTMNLDWEATRATAAFARK
ncbi:MAG TPA: DUF2911 domain-containing protein [Candidatus Acidoferrales bacterium]